MAKQNQELTNPEFNPEDYFQRDEPETVAEGADFGDDFDPELADVAEDMQGYGWEDEDEAPEPEPEAAEDEPEAEEDETPESDESEVEDEPEADAQEEPETDDREAQEEPEPAKEERQRGKPNHMIPKRRLDTEIAKKRALEQELAEARKELARSRAEAAEKAKVSEEQIQGWLKDSAQKALDGDVEEAAKLQAKAFAAMNQNSAPAQEEAAPLDPEQMMAEVEARFELKQTVKQVMEDFPMLNQDSDQFDEQLNEEAVEFQDYYLSKGYTPAAAVEKAVQALAGVHGLKAASAAAEPEVAPKPPARNTKPDIKKKLDAASRQPNEPTSRRGNKAAPEETVDIFSLDDEQLLALPESVRARLRGD